MKLNHIVAALSLAAAAPAFATIAANTSDNGELFLVVYDDAAKVSYTKDLGLTQNDFFTAGQSETGANLSYSLAGDTFFDSFLSQTTAGNLRWGVIAIETFGGNSAGRLRVYTTVATGSEDLVGTWTNQLISNGAGSTQAGQFFASVNVTGSHGAVGQLPDISVNGSSVNKESDDGFGYFGKPGGLSFNYNGNAPFDATNAVGTASNFYYLTRSGTNQAGTVLVDQFDNSFGAASFLLENGADGYELTYTLSVPEPETYALMFAGLAAIGFVARRRKTGV